MSGQPTRLERDLLGEKAVPADAYYGVQTARALENFHISGVPLSLYPNLIKALGMVKMAAARANVDCGQFSREILTGSMDGTIRVWYAEPRELRTEFTVPVSGSGPLGQVAYVSDRIITADYFGDVFVYSASGKLQATIKAGTEGAQGSWNRAGTKIMVVANHGAQYPYVGELWHATGSGFTLQRTFSYSNTGVHNAFISPDGSRVAIVGDDNSRNSSNSYTNYALIIDVRNTDTGRLVRTLRAVKSIQAVAFNPNGRQIVGIDAAGQIEAWNGTATHPRVLGSPGSSYFTVSFNQSGSEFVVASDGGAISVRNMSSWSARRDAPNTHPEGEPRHPGVRHALGGASSTGERARPRRARSPT